MLKRTDVMGSKLCHPHQPTEGQIKTPVQCVENLKGLGGVIIYDQETFTINKPHLVAVPDHRALIRGKSSVRPVLLKRQVKTRKTNA